MLTLKDWCHWNHNQKMGDNTNLTHNLGQKERIMWPLYTNIQASHSPTAKLYGHKCSAKNKKHSYCMRFYSTIHNPDNIHGHGALVNLGCKPSIHISMGILKEIYLLLISNSIWLTAQLEKEHPTSHVLSTAGLLAWDQIISFYSWISHFTQTGASLASKILYNTFFWVSDW